MKSKLPSAVLVVSEKGIQVGIPPQSVFSLNFSPNVFRDLEVQDKNSLKTVVTDFIQKNKIPLSEIVIILSQTTYYEQELKVTSRAEAAAEVPKFLDIVPFQQTEWRVFPAPSGYRVVVLNRDLFQSLGEVFRGIGFSISGVYPDLVLPQLQSAKGIITPELVKYVLKVTSSLREFNFLAYTPAPGPQNRFSTNSKERKKEVVLICVFLGLLLTLVLVLVFRKP